MKLFCSPGACSLSPHIALREALSAVGLLKGRGDRIGTHISGRKA